MRKLKSYSAAQLLYRPVVVLLNTSTSQKNCALVVLCLPLVLLLLRLSTRTSSSSDALESLSIQGKPFDTKNDPSFEKYERANRILHGGGASLDDWAQENSEREDQNQSNDIDRFLQFGGENIGAAKAKKLIHPPLQKRLEININNTSNMTNKDIEDRQPNEHKHIKHKDEKKEKKLKNKMGKKIDDQIKRHFPAIDKKQEQLDTKQNRSLKNKNESRILINEKEKSMKNKMGEKVINQIDRHIKHDTEELLNEFDVKNDKKSANYEAQDSQIPKSIEEKKQMNKKPLQLQKKSKKNSVNDHKHKFDKNLESNT